MVKLISFAWNFLQTGTENTNKNQKGGFLNEIITGGWKLAAGVHFFVTAAKYHFFLFLQLNIEFAANGF